MFNFGPRKGNPGTKLYEVLEVERTASETEIRKSFKKLSLRYHPDRPNGDDEKFKQINLAHEILSDKEKREIYDQYGEEGLEQMAQQGGDSGIPEDLIDLIMPGMRRQRQRRGPAQSQTIGVKLEVSLEDLYTGKTVNFEFKRNVKCVDCNATGSTDPNAVVDCKQCKGRGQRVEIHQMGMMVQQHVSPCMSCRGSGKSIKPGSECKKCNGQKMVEEDFKTEVSVRPGTSTGDKICLKGKAHEHPDCVDTGDLYLIVEEKPSKNGLVREGDNLVFEKDLDLVDALCGSEFYIKQLDGRFLKASYTGVISPKQVMKIEGEGMPKLNSGSNGDLYIKFNINFPSKLDDKRKELLRKILPKPKKVLEQNPSSDDEIDEKDLTVLEETHFPSPEEVHDSEEEFERHEGGPECVTH